MGSQVSPSCKTGLQSQRQEAQKRKDAKERISCPCTSTCSTCKSTCTSSACTCSSPSCCPPACSSSSSSSCSSCPCSPCSSCSARPDGPDGSHRWWSCRRLCCGSCCWQRYHRDVLRRLLLCTCTCTRTSCPCTSCTCSRAERANRALRLGNQAVPAVQPDPVRHHQLRGFQ